MANGLMIDVRPISGVRPEGTAEQFIEASPERLQTIGELVAQAGASLMNALDSATRKPKSCSIEFGIEAGGEVGVPLVTKGKASANFNVTLTWEWDSQHK